MSSNRAFAALKRADLIGPFHRNIVDYPGAKFSHQIELICGRETRTALKVMAAWFAGVAIIMVCRT